MLGDSTLLVIPHGIETRAFAQTLSLVLSTLSPQLQTVYLDATTSLCVCRCYVVVFWRCHKSNFGCQAHDDAIPGSSCAMSPTWSSSRDIHTTAARAHSVGDLLLSELMNMSASRTDDSWKWLS